MAFVLKRGVGVVNDQHQLVQLPAGTLLDSIPEDQLAQLAPDHFVDPDDPEARPADWRGDDARERDAAQAEALNKYRGES